MIVHIGFTGALLCRLPHWRIMYAKESHFLQLLLPAVVFVLYIGVSPSFGVRVCSLAHLENGTYVPLLV